MVAAAPDSKRSSDSRENCPSPAKFCICKVRDARRRRQEAKDEPTIIVVLQ